MYRLFFIGKLGWNRQKKNNKKKKNKQKLSDTLRLNFRYLKFYFLHPDIIQK